MKCIDGRFLISFYSDKSIKSNYANEFFDVYIHRIFYGQKIVKFKKKRK